MHTVLGKRLRELPGPIMVTGHTGFKGTWLTLLLEELGVPVVGFSLPAERYSMFERLGRLAAIPETFSDIRNLISVKHFMDEHQPSVVIHLAAQSLVLESYRSPLDTFEINVMGTANVLASAFAIKSVRTVGIVTTDKVYLNDNSERAFVESDPLMGKDPYSASKVAAESVVSAWQHQADLSQGPSVTSFRSGNVIGGGDWATDRLVPDLVRAFTTKSQIVLRNPASTRPWQHVLDPLVGYLMAIEKALEGKLFKALNFGPDDSSLSVRRVSEICARVWPDPTYIHSYVQSSVGNIESRYLNLDSNLARKELRWHPVWTQEEAVISSIKWWGAVLNNGVTPEKACKKDIRFVLDSLIKRN